MMWQAVVRAYPGADTLTIELELAGRPRFMDRPTAEALDKTLARIQKNAVKKEIKGTILAGPRQDQSCQPRGPAGLKLGSTGTAQLKRQKEVLQAAAEDVPVALFDGPTTDSSVIAGDVLNGDAWKRAKLLVIDSIEYRIIYNPPSASKVRAGSAICFVWPPATLNDWCSTDGDPGPAHG